MAKQTLPETQHSATLSAQAREKIADFESWLSDFLDNATYTDVDYEEAGTEAARCNAAADHGDGPLLQTLDAAFSTIRTALKA